MEGRAGLSFKELVKGIKKTNCCIIRFGLFTSKKIFFSRLIHLRRQEISEERPEDQGLVTLHNHIVIVWFLYIYNFFLKRYFCFLSFCKSHLPARCVSCSI